MSLGMIALSVVLAAPAKTEPLTPAVKDLQGKWQAVSIEEKGKQWNRDETREVAIEIVGDVLIYKRGEPYEKFRIVHIEPSKSPARMDLTLIADGVDPKKACRVIYEVNADKLKLCLGHEFKADDEQDRPAEFTTGDKRPPQGRLLFAMERMKK